MGKVKFHHPSTHLLDLLRAGIAQRERHARILLAKLAHGRDQELVDHRRRRSRCGYALSGFPRTIARSEMALSKSRRILSASALKRTASCVMTTRKRVLRSNSLSPTDSSNCWMVARERRLRDKQPRRRRGERPGIWPLRQTSAGDAEILRFMARAPCRRGEGCLAAYIRSRE